MFDSFPQPGQKLMPINTNSTLDWPGLSSQKFHGNRRHLRPQDQLNGYEGAPLPFLGRKHYSSKYSAVGEYKPHLKVFPTLSNQTTDLSKLQATGGLLKLTYVPPQRKLRPELLHLQPKKSGHFEDQAKGIRTFETANRLSSNQYQLENQLQQKARIDGLYDQRNHIEVNSLGDKAYKHPEYSTDFFKPGGLVPGATVSDNRQKVVSEKNLQSARVPGKLTWKEREKLEEVREDKRQVEELDAWEEHTLKEANPNWKDPEKFFDNEDNNNAKNDPKKGGKAPPAKKK